MYSAVTHLVPSDDQLADGELLGARGMCLICVSALKSHRLMVYVIVSLLWVWVTENNGKELYRMASSGSNSLWCNSSVCRPKASAKRLLTLTPAIGYAHRQASCPPYFVYLPQKIFFRSVFACKDCLYKMLDVVIFN